MNVCQRSDMAQNYDSFQPCFFETEAEQEFYADTPSPSHDIWKKFELLPTPPRSPKHETFATDSSCYIVDKLKMVSELLDDDAVSQTMLYPCGMISPAHLSAPCEGTATAKALIQDCMWSVTVANNGGGSASSPGAKAVAAVTGARDYDGKARFTQPLNTSGTDTVDINVTTDCVDPMAVFPYPLNDSKTNAVSHVGDYCHTLGTETPSDSDDDDEEEEDDVDDVDEADDDDDDDDDDEIDVVTVGNKTACLQQKQILPAAESHSAQVAAMHSYSSQRSEPSTPVRSPIRTHHTYSLTIRHRHKRTASPTLPRLVVKRQRMVDSSELQNALQNRFSSSRLSSRGSDSGDSGGSAANSRVSSDSEECGEGKRAQHNVLERKRRDDLKSSFHRLRDIVPEMHRQERTPKVTILRKAAAHVLHIRATHRRLESDLDQQRLAQKRLKEQLRTLGVC